MVLAVNWGVTVGNLFFFFFRNVSSNTLSTAWESTAFTFHFCSLSYLLHSAFSSPPLTSVCLYTSLCPPSHWGISLLIIQLSGSSGAKGATVQMMVPHWTLKLPRALENLYLWVREMCAGCAPENKLLFPAVSFERPDNWHTFILTEPCTTLCLRNPLCNLIHHNLTIGHYFVRSRQEQWPEV